MCALAGSGARALRSVQKMILALQPGQGVGDLRFGVSRATAEQFFGSGIRKDHSADKILMKSLILPDHGLILYFDERDRMTSVMVDADSRSFTLLGEPIHEIFGDPPTSESIKKWIQDHGFNTRAELDFMGCYHYDVGDDGLSFAFPDEGMPAVQLRSSTEQDAAGQPATPL